MLLMLLYPIVGGIPAKEGWRDYVSSRNEGNLRDLIASLETKKRSLEKKIRVFDSRHIQLNPGLQQQRARLEQKLLELDSKIQAAGFKLEALRLNFADYEVEQDDEEILLMM